MVRCRWKRMQYVYYSVTLTGKTRSPQPAHTEAPQHLFQSETQRRAALGPTSPRSHHRASASYCRRRPQVNQCSQPNQGCTLIHKRLSECHERSQELTCEQKLPIWCWRQRVPNQTPYFWCYFICPLVETILINLVQTNAGCVTRDI